MICVAGGHGYTVTVAEAIIIIFYAEISTGSEQRGVTNVRRHNLDGVLLRMQRVYPASQPLCHRWFLVTYAKCL